MPASLIALAGALLAIAPASAEDLLIENASVVDGTELTFTTWPADPDLAGAVSSAAGYHICLTELTMLLERGSAPPMTEIDAIVFRFEEAYKQRFGLG